MHTSTTAHNINNIQQTNINLASRFTTPLGTAPGVRQQRNKRRARLSKFMHKHIRKHKRTQRRQKISTILSNFSNLKHIPGIKSRRDKHLIAEITDQQGHCRTNRQDIADIFADFYAELYQHKPYHNECTETNSYDGPTTSIPEFKIFELDIALGQLKDNNCKDASGLIAEMFKTSGYHMRDALLNLYNEIIQPQPQIPSIWKHKRIN